MFISLDRLSYTPYTSIGIERRVGLNNIGRKANPNFISKRVFLRDLKHHIERVAYLLTPDRKLIGLLFSVPCQL